jgi:hypothetical protein
VFQHKADPEKKSDVILKKDPQHCKRTIIMGTSDELETDQNVYFGLNLHCSRDESVVHSNWAKGVEAFQFGEDVGRSIW